MSPLTGKVLPSPGVIMVFVSFVGAVAVSIGVRDVLVCVLRSPLVTLSDTGLNITIKKTTNKESTTKNNMHTLCFSGLSGIALRVSF